MDIYLLRHGHAVSDAPSDALRPLSSKGEKQVTTVISAIATEIASVQKLFVSPYLRAQQTAKIVQEQTAIKELETLATITPSGNPYQLINFLYELNEKQGVESILLVTHNPFVNALLDLLGGFEVGRYRMGTASIAALHTDVVAAECAKLKWIKHA